MQPRSPHPTRRGTLTGVCAVAGALTAGSRPALARAAPVYTGPFSRLGLKGHDPVAHATMGRPVPGSAALEAAWNGATWRFASPGSLAAFRADPERWAPAYGGYCAWAIAKNYLAPGDPRYWRVVGDRLYVNYDSGVQRDWERDIPGFIKAADANWPAILDRN